MTKRRWACEPRGEYPENWASITARAKERADWRCEHCGMEFWPITGKAKDVTNRDGKPAILTVHHLNGDKGDCRYQNLLVCCQACHLHIQALWEPGRELPPVWGHPPKWLSDRGLNYQVSMQANFFDVVEPKTLTFQQYKTLMGYDWFLEDHAAFKMPHGFTKADRRRPMIKLRTALRESAQAWEEYSGMVRAGKIRPPTDLEILQANAEGHPDNPVTQAARRVLAKREARRLKKEQDHDTHSHG